MIDEEGKSGSEDDLGLTGDCFQLEPMSPKDLMSEPLSGSPVSAVGWSLWLDDERNPPTSDWIVCRTSEEAKRVVLNQGPPSRCSLDHDLGGDDTVMAFLYWLAAIHYDAGPPDYVVHSANPVGAANIVGFLESWRRSLFSR